MKKVTTSKGVSGPFDEIVRNSADNGFLCDGVDYQDTVIGDNGVVSDWTDPVPVDEQNRQNVLLEIDRLTEEKMAGGFTYNNKLIYTDEKAMGRLNGMLNRIQVKGLIDSVPVKFKSRDGDVYNITVGLFKTIFTDLSDYLNDIEEHAVDLTESVEGAADQDALDAIDINAGWP